MLVIHSTYSKILVHMTMHIMNGLYISLDESESVRHALEKWDIHILETSLNAIHNDIRLSEPPVQAQAIAILVYDICRKFAKLTFIITTAIIKSNQLFLKLMFNLTRRG